MVGFSQIKIPHKIKIAGIQIGSDGAKILASWTGTHLFSVDLRDAENKVKIEDLPDDVLKITVPSFGHRASYVDTGSLKLRTLNSSWFIPDAQLAETVMRLVLEKNDGFGKAYGQSADAQGKLRAACVAAVTGIVYRRIPGQKKISVDCPSPSNAATAGPMSAIH
jgi:hypothetical protein